MSDLELNPEVLADAHVVLQECREWVTGDELALTMRRRDQTWTPVRVGLALSALIVTGRVRIAETSAGSPSVPPRYRMVADTPGEVPPGHTGEAMQPAESFAWSYRCSLCDDLVAPDAVAAHSQVHRRSPDWPGRMSMTREDHPA